MGMFDYYEVTNPIGCQICNIELSEFRGKDGENALFVWREGERFPSNQRVSMESRLDKESMKKFELPRRFKIYSYCKNHHLTELQCELDENFRWNKIAVKL